MLHEVLAFLEEKLDSYGATMKQSMALNLALEEAFVNVAHYAYEGGKGNVSIGIGLEGDAVSIVLKDKGMAFDPLGVKEPDIKAKAEDRSFGGLGIYMIRKSVDSCSYERKDGYNILTMRKKIS